MCFHDQLAATAGIVETAICQERRLGRCIPGGDNEEPEKSASCIQSFGVKGMMANFKMELSHLERADRHIARARHLIAEAEERVSEGRSYRRAMAASLDTMKGTLTALEGHRDLIVQALTDIAAGITRAPDIGPLQPRGTQIA